VASGETPTSVLSFETNVRAGNICSGPLAVAHNYSAALTNQNKTGFVTLDEQETIGELRSIAWSPDGKQLAIVGNTTGTGNIYLTDSTGNLLQPVVSNSELGYLMTVAWSRDGKRLLTWSSQNNIVSLINTDGKGLIEREFNLQLFASPQFAPDSNSMYFYGAIPEYTVGLFEFKFDDREMILVSPLVEDDTAFAWSLDGSLLAYIEMDRSAGEARLIKIGDNPSVFVLATLPIPKGSGSSIPDVANLSWSSDGKFLVFEFGRSASDRAVYLAYADGTGLVKLADSAYAPAISRDGNCLAYISNKQVFLLDLTSTNATPLFLANLPAGRSIADYRLDKLQWGTEIIP
jgi:Tol biopolymer transport system component